MTFLELCQMTNTLTGTQGTISTTVGVTGHQATIVTYVTNAWTDLQNLRQDWEFLRANVALNTVVAQTEYTITDIFGAVADPVGKWIYDMLLYDSRPIQGYTKDAYVRRDIVSNSPNTPSAIAIDYDSNNIHINPPDAVYALDLHYFKKPQSITLDADIPLCPSEFHIGIAYKAAADIGLYVGRQEIYDEFRQRADMILGDLMRRKLTGKRLRLGGGIA